MPLSFIWESQPSSFVALSIMQYLGEISFSKRTLCYEENSISLESTWVCLMSAKRDFFENIQKLMHDAKYRCNSVFFILLSQAINFTVQRRILPLFSLQFRNTNYATRLPHNTKYATHNKRMLRHFYQTPIALKQENLRHLSKAFFFCIFGHTWVPKSGSN